MRHGGDLGAAGVAFPDAPLPWIDLSTGINPWPWPSPARFPELPADCWHRLPDERADAELRRAAAIFYGVADPARVIAVPGTQSALQLLPRLVTPGEVAVVGPTYNEHARCWSMGGHQVTEVGQIDDGLNGNARVVVVVNPNNPDGRVIPTDILSTAANRLAQRGGMLVVDEAFADSTPGMSVAPDVGTKGLVVLRSFGKFFGLAGVRLGFVLGDDDLIGRMAAALGPWAVSGPALAVGCAALSDADWITQTRTRLTFAAARLERLLLKHGFTVGGGTSLFQLAISRDADVWFHNLGAHGIWTRRFAAYPDRLRLGLPGDETAWNRLAAALDSGASPR